MPWQLQMPKLKVWIPHCTAYKRIFKEITDRATKEMLSGSGMVPSVPTQKKGKNTIMSINAQRFLNLVTYLIESITAYM